MKNPENRSLVDLLADLEISEAQLAAGDILSGDKVLEDLRASITRLETKPRKMLRREAVPRR